MDILKGIETESLSRETRDALLRKAKEGNWKRAFHPGSGGKPPLLVGRREQADRINDLLEELMLPPSDERDIHAVTLHGPRGAGKTVLLDVATQALKAAAQGEVGVIDVDGRRLRDEATLINSLLAHVPASGTTSTTVTGGGSAKGSIKVESLLDVNAGGRAGTSRTTSRPEGFASLGGVADVLRRYWEAYGVRPLVTIDEAHRGAPDGLGDLLNGIQALKRAGVPCAAILSGTPDLISVLEKADVTWYLDRNEEERLVPVGGIVEADCARAVEAPLEAMGVGFDADALWAAASWCSGNAYFTQLLGRSALEEAAKDGGGVADFSAGGPVWERFRAGAVRRYTRTWNDLDKLGLTGCARQLGALWRWASSEGGGVITSERVERGINSGLRHPPTHKSVRLSEDEAKERFAHLGLLWSPSGDPKGPWELGLPSFFDYVEEQYLDKDLTGHCGTLPALIADEPLFIPEVESHDDTRGGRMAPSAPRRQSKSSLEP